MRAFSIIAVSGLAAAAGCGSGSSGPDAVIASYDCASDTRGMTYAPGLEIMGSAKFYNFKLLDATPAPPLRGNNTWVLEVNTVTNGVVGDPAPGLEATMRAVPFMPDHQHGSPIIVEIAPVSGQPGQYTLDPVNLWMPGLWETTINVGSGAMSDEVVYKFCLAS